MTIVDVDVVMDQKQKKRAVLAAARATAAKKAHKKKVAKKERRSRPALERSDSLQSIKSSCTLSPIEEADNESLEANSSHHKKSKVHQEIHIKSKVQAVGRQQEIQIKPTEQAVDLKNADVEMGLEPTDDSGDSNSSIDSDSDCAASASNGSRSSKRGRNRDINKEAAPSNNQCFSGWSKRRWMVVSGCLVVVVVAIICGAAIAVSGGSASATTSVAENTDLATPDNSTPSKPSGNSKPSKPSNDNKTPVPSLNSPVLDKKGVLQSIYLNAGAHPNAVYEDARGVQWISDFDFLKNGGNVYNACPANITGTSDPDLFCTERWFRDNVGSFDINVAPGGATYQVVMHFAEMFHKGANKRLFDIYAQNKLVRGAFDIYSSAGKNGTAVALMTEVTVPDGVLSVRFVPIPGKDNPKVNAIEVHDISNARKANEYEVVAAEPTAEQEQPSVVVEEAPKEEMPIEEEEDVVADEEFEDEESADELTVFQVPFFINAGGITFEDKQGHLWVTDSTFTANIGGNVNVYEQCSSGNDEEPLEQEDPLRLLYCSERWFRGNVGGMYDLPITENEVELFVTLHFAELFFTEIGERVFDVIVEGQKVKGGFDILKETGGTQLTATTLTKRVWVTDGSLSINLLPIVGNAKISAIEVRSV